MRLTSLGADFHPHHRRHCLCHHCLRPLVLAGVQEIKEVLVDSLGNHLHRPVAGLVHTGEALYPLGQRKRSR